MKTNNIFYTGLLLCLALQFSCKKLDIDPPDKISSGIFWKTPADADLALTGLYNTLYASAGGVDQYGPFWWDNFSDNSYSQHSLAGSQNALIAGLTPTSGGFQSDYYKNDYVAIAAINSFLANVAKVLSGEDLEKYKGEAFFLRGFNYFWLARLYGNVPLLTADPFTLDYKSVMGKSDREAILKQAETDLDSAIAYLPDVKYTTGHVVKAVAEGYMAQLYLFENRYAEAAAMSKEIIDSHLFSLNDCYSCNFYKPDQQSSPEIMFSVQYQAPAIPHPMSIGMLLIGSGWKDVQGTQNLIDAYECTDGKPISTSALYDPAHPYEHRDPRLRMSFFFPGDGTDQGWPYPGTVGQPGINEWVKGFYPTKKYLDPKVVNPTNGLLDDQDYVLLRYAEVMLMYAEAQNEVSGPDPSIYQQMNLIRERAGMPDIATGQSKESMRALIRQERRVELALEGQRYFDLRRWGIAKQTLNGFVQNPLTPGVKTLYKDNYGFWPLPQTEIDRNKPALLQNAGY